MPDTITVQNVTFSVEVPRGWRQYDKTVPELLYPMELTTLANFDLPQTGPLGDTVAPQPRVDLIPDRGAILWLTLGDRDTDQTESEPFTGVSRLDRLFDAMQPLQADEQTPSVFRGVREYRRTVGLGSTLYIDLWAWVPARLAGPTDDLQQIVRSLTFAY